MQGTLLLWEDWARGSWGFGRFSLIFAVLANGIVVVGGS